MPLKSNTEPKNRDARIQWANPVLAKRPLCPIALIDNLNIFHVTNDAGFWILTSAAAHLNGYDLNDGDPSTVATYFPEATESLGGAPVPDVCEAGQAYFNGEDL